MGIYLDRAKALRERTDIHFNCAQSVLVPFADRLGIPEDTAFNMAAHFGGGMKMGATCGAVTGALMVLGLAGRGEVPEAQALYAHFKAHHDGMLDCRDLLRVNAERGGQRKPHCGAMVFEAVEYLETVLGER